MEMPCLEYKTPSLQPFGAGVDLQLSVRTALLRTQDLPIPHVYPTQHPSPHQQAWYLHQDGLNPVSSLDWLSLSSACDTKISPPSKAHLSSFSWSRSKRPARRWLSRWRLLSSPQSSSERPCPKRQPSTIRQEKWPGESCPLSSGHRAEYLRATTPKHQPPQGCSRFKS